MCMIVYIVSVGGVTCECHVGVAAAINSCAAELEIVLKSHVHVGYHFENETASPR